MTAPKTINEGDRVRITPISRTVTVADLDAAADRTLNPLLRALADSVAGRYPYVPAAGEATMNGAELIAAERLRQVEAEGWTPEHDAQHSAGDLARAASCYLNAPAYSPPTRHAVVVVHGPDAGEPWAPFNWPWAARYWKPTPDDRVRELVKAGALIAAEIDRLQASAGWVTCPRCGVRRVLAGGCATRECIEAGL